jgi:hypothetical protein
MLIWILFWCGGAVLALIGSTRSLPIIDRLVRHRFMYRLAWVGNVVLGVCVLDVVTVAVHATSLTRQDDEPASAYLLYDDMGVVPRWVFNVGFYRITLGATARWGPGSVVVAPLDKQHLRLALKHGKVVFLACHGREGNITTPRLRIVPHPLVPDDGERANLGVFVTVRETDDPEQQWFALPTRKSIRLVYITACDSGAKAALWDEAFAPAEVKTFDRLSTVAEHIVWLWVDGPERVRAMK